MAKIMVGWVDGGTVEGAFTESLLGMFAVGVLNQTVCGYIRFESGPILSYARNQLAEKFLDSPADWLLSIDSDMVFPADLPDRLLQSADPDTRPIVAACCYGYSRENGVFPAVYRVGTDGFYLWHDFPPELLQVDAAGAACTLTHRQAFEKISKVGPGRWYDHLTVKDHPVGEDLAFCLRAKAAGVPIWVDGRIPIRHLKVKAPLDRPVYEQWREHGALAIPI